MHRQGSLELRVARARCGCKGGWRCSWRSGTGAAISGSTRMVARGSSEFEGRRSHEHHSEALVFLRERSGSEIGPRGGKRKWKGKEREKASRPAAASPTCEAGLPRAQTGRLHNPRPPSHSDPTPLDLSPSRSAARGERTSVPSRAIHPSSPPSTARARTPRAPPAAPRYPGAPSPSSSSSGAIG